MTMSSIAESSLDSIQTSAVDVTRHAGERSPLVAISLAMAVTGCLIATAVPGAISELLWPLLFLSFAIEEEVRTFDVPEWWGGLFLIARLGFLGLTADTPALLQGVAGAIVAGGLFLPLCGAGYLRRGTLIAVASLGAIVGIKTLPLLLLLAALIGIPFAAIWSYRGSNPVSLPVMTAIGFAMATLPYLELL